MQNDHIREDEAVEDEAALDDYETEMLSGRNSSLRGRHSAHGLSSSAAPHNDLPNAQQQVNFLLCLASEADSKHYHTHVLICNNFLRSGDVTCLFVSKITGVRG